MILQEKMYDDKFLTIKVLVFKVMYQAVLWRLRKQYGKRKIKVGFLVSEIAKWKGQTLFDYLEKTTDFAPIIYVYPTKHELNEQESQIEDVLRDKAKYFRESGMATDIVWDTKDNQRFPSERINSDIVFYQQPWEIPPAPFLKEIAPKALTFYFPYYLVNNYIPQLEIDMYLHHFIFRYILQNKAQVNLYKSSFSPFRYAGKMIALGHPCTDLYYLNKDYKPTKNYVIYAPHFSFKGSRSPNKELPYYSSTFLEQGAFVLEYAKKHPEINWVFKPHPRLKSELTEQKVWNKEEVEVYYKEWERIGTVCYDSHYAELFLESKAMITDCSSFLSEYSCTGKPLIRLIPNEGKSLPPPNPVLEKLYDSFYKVYNNTELLDVLDTIVVHNMDSKKGERWRCVQETHLADHFAAQSITEYLRALIKG